jgi:SAM-dependent methyltransferase
MASDYAYDQGWEQERARLAGLESLWDPGTRALLAEHGAVPGARVLEVGGGGGALVAWLAERVGSVLVTDIDTRFLDGLASDVVEVRRHDIRTDPLPEGAFDLIHARLVLEHLPERTEVLAKLTAALAPGGWLVIEDYDWTAFGFLGAEDLSGIADAVMDLMAEAGFERDYGRRVAGDLAACGLADVRGEARARIIDTTSPGYDFFRLSFEALRPRLIETGRLTPEAADAASAHFDAGSARVLTPLLVAGLARRT